MAATWTLNDLTRVKRAIRSGALSVGYADGKRVQYRSLDELFAIKRQIEEELGITSGPIRRVAAHTKGVRAGGTLGRSGFDRC